MMDCGIKEAMVYKIHDEEANNICEKYVDNDQTKLFEMVVLINNYICFLYNFELPTRRVYRDTGTFWFTKNVDVNKIVIKLNYMMLKI